MFQNVSDKDGEEGKMKKILYAEKEMPSRMFQEKSVQKAP